MSLTIYDWGAFRLEHDAAIGSAITRYEGRRWTGSAPVPEDTWHGARLGLTPGQHRLAHELAHHLIGLYYYRDPDGSPVLWRDAYHVPQEAGGWVKADWSEADREEWLVTAITYRARGKEHDGGAILALEERGVDTAALCALLAWLLEAPARGARLIILDPPHRAEREAA